MGFFSSLSQQVLQMLYFCWTVFSPLRSMYIFPEMTSTSREKVKKKYIVCGCQLKSSQLSLQPRDETIHIEIYNLQKTGVIHLDLNSCKDQRLQKDLHALLIHFFYSSMMITLQQFKLFCNRSRAACFPTDLDLLFLCFPLNVSAESCKCRWGRGLCWPWVGWLPSILCWMCSAAPLSSHPHIFAGFEASRPP